MSISELQAVLNHHADDVVDHGLVGRAAAARRQAVGIRRRRTAVALAVAVAVPVAGFALLSSGTLDRSGRQVTPSNDHTLRSSVAADEAYAGRTLIDSIGVRGTDEATLTVSSDVSTEWTASCWGLGSTYVLHVEIDEGTFPGEAPCDEGRPIDPGVTYQLDSRFPTGPHTVRAWITGVGELTDAELESAVLLIGAYQLPEPVTTIAGIDTFAEQPFYEKVYSLGKYGESEPGAARFTSSYRQRTDADVAIQIFATGSGTNQVQLYIDGIYQGDLTIPDNYMWGTRTRGPHTVELRILGAVPADARLGVAWRPFTRRAP